MKILLAVDGSASSKTVVEEVVRRPWPQGSEIRVISVYEVPVAPAVEPWAIPVNYFVEMEKAARERTKAIVKAAVSELQAGYDKSLKITSEIIGGPPNRAILDEAESWEADLIVVGSHGYGVLKRLLIGSVSHAVALHAKCSVEIVRSRHERESEK